MFTGKELKIAGDVDSEANTVINTPTLACASESLRNLHQLTKGVEYTDDESSVNSLFYCDY